jgi:hypothetical protein
MQPGQPQADLWVLTLVTWNCNPYHFRWQFLEVMRWWAGLRMKLS